jgi:hypothetical protein
VAAMTKLAVWFEWLKRGQTLPAKSAEALVHAVMGVGSVHYVINTKKNINNERKKNNEKKL